ncbi:MAG: rod shape-determining protein MreC [Chitinispirillales bacterium]|jgi:rod shape-determining protein MreC|nr:rod shape-determining protein MreC [Chitinispirillales bacterium]
MRWIIDLIVRHRNICSLLLTVALSVAMIIAQPSTQASIVRYLSMTIFYPAYAVVSQVSSFTGVYSENKRLRQELAELSTQIQVLRDQSAENMRLRGLVGFSEHTLYTLTPVRVVARDPSYFYKSVLVSGGASQGVGMYMPIVGEHGAVGKVSQVMGNMSMIQLLRDPSSRASVMVNRSRAVGILQTDNARDFFVRLRSHEDAQAGDTIVTSGLGGIYPKGLTVGVVEKIDDKSNLLFKRAYIDFSVDFDKLEELFVMRLPPQWAAQRAELDSVKMEK